MPTNDLPSPDIMRATVRAALAEATEMIARQAEAHASRVPPGISAKDAMLAFARAIRSTTAKTLEDHPHADPA